MHQRGNLSYKVPLKGSFMGYEDWHFHSWHCVCTLTLCGVRDSSSDTWSDSQVQDTLDRAMSPQSQSLSFESWVADVASEATAAWDQETSADARRLGTDVSVKTFFMKCLFQRMGSDLGVLSVAVLPVLLLFLLNTHTHRRNTLVSQVGHILPSVQVQQFAPSAYINSSALINHFHLMPLYTSTTLHF